MISVDVLAFAAFQTAKISIPTIIDGLLGRVSARVCDRRLDGWSRALVEQARIQLEVTGREHVALGESYVVMSNHQSHYDIPVVFQSLGIPLRMVAKKELFGIPIMGRAMRESGFVEVDRGRHARAVRSLSSARERLERDGTSVWIAPEGTRSKTGELGKFKRGGFHLAVDAGLRILPIAIDGSRNVLRAKGLEVHKGQTVRVAICPPIDAPTYGRERVAELIGDVREAIASRLPEELRPVASTREAPGLSSD
jgi:1-acyl-sn-glycerol-3-phosphate acyltransferase